jgi:hypothetical protein
MDTVVLNKNMKMDNVQKVSLRNNTAVLSDYDKLELQHFWWYYIYCLLSVTHNATAGYNTEL